MAEMVNSSRLSNGVKSTALMRRAYHDAMTVRGIAWCSAAASSTCRWRGGN